MAVYDILPDTNVKQEDIRDTLNDYGGDVTNDATTYFTTDAAINMWSRFKPVWYKGDFIDIKTAYKAQYNGYESDLPGFHSDGDCGVAPLGRVYDGGDKPQYERVKEASLIKWGYALPLGGTYTDAYGKEKLCPYRMGDFRGYNPNALPPIYVSNNFQEQTIELSKVKRVNIVVDMENSDDYSLQSWDLAQASSFDLKRCELYGVMYKWNGDFMQIATGGRYIMEEDGTYNNNVLTFDMSKASYARYTVYACLRYTPESGNVYFYPIPSGRNSATFPLTVNVKITPTESGGIANWETDVYVSPRYSSSLPDFRLFYDTIEEGSAKYYMMNTTGRISMRVKLTNNGTTPTTYTRSAFRLTAYPKSINVMPYAIRSDSGSTLSNVVIPAKSSIWVYLLWDNDILPFSSSVTGKYESVEVSLSINDIEQLNGALYYHFGAEGFGNL